jgi:hypothetical protein
MNPSLSDPVCALANDPGCVLQRETSIAHETLRATF